MVFSAEKIFHHRVEYPDNDRIPLADVAATLIAYERMAPVLGQILEELHPGLEVEHITLSVNSIRSGSLSEALIVAVLATFQEDLTREVPEVIEALTGAQLPEKYDTLATVIFMLIVFFGARYLFEGGRKKKREVPPSIIGDYNTYVNIAAERIGASPEEIEGSVRRAVGKKEAPKMARAAVDFFRPAKRGKNGRILPAGMPEISKETTAAFPGEATLALLDEDTVPLPFPLATLEIRATDRDKANQGWAGRLIVPGFETKRLPVKLYPMVDHVALARHETAKVEAVLEQKPTDDGDLKPILIHVVRVINDGVEHP
jgi:hypothetical protein